MFWAAKIDRLVTSLKVIGHAVHPFSNKFVPLLRLGKKTTYLQQPSKLQVISHGEQYRKYGLIIMY